MGVVSFFPKGFQLLIVVALTVYWLLLLKLGHRGIQNNVWEILGEPVGDGTNITSIETTPTNLSPPTLPQLSENNNDHLTLSAPPARPRIPLIDLVNTNPNPPCNPGKTRKRLVTHTILEKRSNNNNNNNNNNKHRKIPKNVHMTSKSRCMTPGFIANVYKWRMDGYAVYIHDDAAVDRLLSQEWPEFPHLQLLAQHCLLKGASTADLWRYLVLWEYGGVYADLDSAPGPRLQNSILAQDDAFFVVEQIGIMSQYFMAGSPKHPYFYLCVAICLERLLVLVNHVGKQNIPVTTGPGVVKVAMIKFMQNVDPVGTYGRLQHGTYTGVGGRTIKVVGSRTGSKNWVVRESMKKEKADGYAAMGMKHFSQIRVKGMNESCHEHLYNMYMKKKTISTTNATTVLLEEGGQETDQDEP
jgi:hypothetical protein